MRVKYKPTGETGTIPDDKFDPTIFEQITPTPTLQPNPLNTPVISQTPIVTSSPEREVRSGLGQTLSDIGGFLAPTISNIVKDTATSAGIWSSNDFGNAEKSMEASRQAIIDQINRARAETDPKKKAFLLKAAKVGSDYLGRVNSESQPKWSEDMGKSVAERSGKAALEAGSYLIPAGKGVTGAMKTGFVSGTMKAASEGSTTAENALPKIVGGGVGSAVLSGVTTGLLELGGKFLEKAGKNLTLKGLRPSKTQIRNFESKTGQPLDEFTRNNKLFEQGTEQVEGELSKLYSQYDDAAIKSGKTVKVSSLIKKFDDKIAELSQYSGSDVKNLIQKLTEEKNVLINDLAGKEEVGLDWVTKNRSVADKFIPKGAFNTDPISAGSKKVVRDLYKETIDDATGGVTKELGSKIKDFEAFKDIAELQQGLGKGNLPAGLITLLSASGGGGIGYAQGGKEGAIKGALLTAGFTHIANNPQVLSMISRALTSIGGKIAGSADTLLPQITSRIIGQKVGSEVLSPSSSPSLPPINSPSGTINNNNGNQQAGNNNIQNTPPLPIITQNVNSVKQNYLTGYSPEDLYQGIMKAQEAGDTKAAAQLRTMYNDETAYQKVNKTKKENVTASIDMMEKLYAPGQKTSLSMGKNTVGLSGIPSRLDVEIKKLTNQEYTDRLNSYKTQMALVAGAINQAAGAGVLNGGEYDRLAMKSFPNEYTSEAVAKAWFDNARTVLNSLPTDRAQALTDLLTAE